MPTNTAWLLDKLHSMVSYGAIPPPGGAGRPARRRPSTAVAAGVVVLAAAALAGMVLLSARTGTVLEGAGGRGMKLARTFSGDSVAVPSTYVDYDRGTTFSPQAPFENSAMDKSLRTQQLSDGGATDEREQVDTDAPHETKYIGAIPVDETVDGMARPLGDVKHLDCYGRDEDPECQTSVMPLFDKAKGAAQLSTKQADADIDAYFAQQQKAAMKARKPIRPKMQGTEKLVDTRGTKFGLSDAAARQQVDTIFGAVSKGRHGANNGALADQDKVIQKKYYSEEKLLKPGSMKSGKTQQLRWANNHGSASKVVLSACDRGVLLCGAGASRLRQGRALVRVVQAFR